MRIAQRLSRCFFSSALALTVGCSSAPVDSGVPESEAEFLFSFVTVADPHITSSSDRDDRLVEFVDWVNDNDEALGVAFVVVLGDIGWNEGLYSSAAMLDALDVPYMPVMGDNEVAAGQESLFYTAFTAAFDRLESSFQDFTRTTGSVWDPVLEQDLHLINFAFTHLGIRFVAMDWASRDSDAIISEMGDLHDFDGGTLEWLDAELNRVAGAVNGSVMLMSHIPMAMTPGGFFFDDQTVLEDALAPYAGQIPFAYAGHLHADSNLRAESGDYDVYVCDALWDDDKSFRVVEVWGSSALIETVETRYTL